MRTMLQGNFCLNLVGGVQVLGVTIYCPILELAKQANPLTSLSLHACSQQVCPSFWNQKLEPLAIASKLYNLIPVNKKHDMWNNIYFPALVSKSMCLG